MRLVWKFATPDADGSGTRTVLSRLTREFRLLGTPEPAFEGSSCYHAVPLTRRTARKALEYLRSQTGVVEDALLEIGVRAPASPASSSSLEGPLPELGWPITEVDGERKSYDWRRHQVYLQQASSGGIDAYHAWRFAGGRGEDVRLVDIERGCDTEHEDLKGPLDGLQVPRHHHGTQTMGVCCADPDNDFGVVGIAHRARVELAPVERGWFLFKQYDRVAAVLERVISSLDPGDVVLIELEASFEASSIPQVTRHTSSLPLELAPDVRDVLQATAERGPYVVEAAGNGGHSLDRFGLDGANRSPAILVGAGHPLTHARLMRSNYGSRVDVQGWGKAVVTTGPGTLQSHLDRRRCYTQSFNGTSSAAAIVAGAVACLSGIVKANGGPPLSPWEMRELLVATGTPQGGDASKRIGPLPNLRAAIQALEASRGALLPATSQPS